MTPYLIGLALTLASWPSAHADPAQNKKLVKAAFTELFVKHDASAAARYWSKPYIEHEPMLPNGNSHEGLLALEKSLPPSFKYELSTAVAEGEFVMVHGRVSGFGGKPVVRADIYRVRNGKIVEHWGLEQAEVPAGESKNSNPMFTPGQ